MAQRAASDQRRTSSLATGFLVRRFSGLALSKNDEPGEDTWGPFGLTLLHEPSEPLIDFIFVHGLGGGSRKTWSRTTSSAHYWPKEWLPNEPRFKNVRIHAFGYNSNWRERGASQLTIHDFGQSLLADMQNSISLNRNEKDTPIVLVGHSMGGIVIKKVLLLAKRTPNYKRIGARIHSLFFLATPHRGANIAELLSNVIKLTLGYGSKPFVDTLRPNTEAIQMVNDEFRNVYQGTEIWSFFETVPTAIGMIVDKGSAVLELPGEHIQLLNADHSHVCKFDDPSDSNYCTLRNAFISTITAIEKTSLPLRTQERQEQMMKLSLYLGIVERPAMDLANVVDKQTEGSCSWLTEKSIFYQWQMGLEDSPSYYWLSGGPASGKSTMAGHVVRYLEECNQDCSYFFFKDSKKGKSSVAELLCSLAWQMAANNTIIRETLLGMCDAGVNIDKNDERAVWRTVFVTRILRTELRQNHFWVIDALDECTDHADLLPLLAKIEKTFPLRVFITSRPSLVIERSFTRENIPNVTDSISLEASLGDIKLFLHEHSPYILADSEEERQELAEAILAKSNGNFLWTSLVVKELEDAVSKEQTDNILISVPNGINELYSHIFDNIMTTPRNATIAKAILRWAVCALRPLLVEELKEALALDIGETLHQLEKTAGSICGNLIYVDTESRVQVAHQTLREFLFRDEDDFSFAMIKSREHARITEICLNYLSSDEMKPPRFRRGSSSSNLHKTNKRSSFAAYATVYFADHLARTTSSNATQLATLNKFFMKNCLTWIEAIAAAQDLTPLIQTAKNVKVFLERRAKYESPLGLDVQNVSEWANDLIRLVGHFGKALLTSPQAIHHLIPSVCPRKSIIFRTFKSHPRGLQAVGLSQEQWDDRLCCIVIAGTKTLSVACRDNKFALGTSNGKIYIYHETTFQEEMQLVHGEPVRRVCFATVNTYLASAGRRKINFWNTCTGRLMWSVDVHDEVIALEFKEDDSMLMAATKGNLVCFWDSESGKEIKTFRFSDWDEEERREHHYRRPPIHAKFSAGLGILGVAYRGRPVSFWDLEDEEFVGQFHRNQAVYPEPFIHAFLINPNPEINLAVVGYQDGATIVFDPEVQRAQAEADTDATVLAASPDGTVLATGSGNGIIKLYDFETMKLLHQIFLHQENIRAIEFNSSGRRFFDIRGDYCNIWEPSVLVRRTASGDDNTSVDLSEKVPEMPLLTTAITFDNDLAIVTIAAHHESDFVFCGRENGSVAAYATKTGKVVQELFSHKQNVAIDFLEWNQGTNILASADRGGRFTVRSIVITRLGQLQMSEPILDEDHSSVIRQIVLSKSGKRLLVSTADFDVLWDLENLSIVLKYSITEPRSSWKWTSHPELDRFFLFLDCHIRVFDANNFQELSQGHGFDLQTPQLPITDVVFPAQARNFWIYYSATAGLNPLAPSLQFWPSKILSPEIQSASTLFSHDNLARELKAVIGLYKSWLVFLNHNGWVCSINTDTAAYDMHYIRHFFIPLQWHGTSGGNVPVALTQRGSVVIAVRTEVVAFHNGLDFEEKVKMKN